MRFARIIERVTTQPWMATPGAYKAIVRVLESRLAGTVDALGPNWPLDDDDDDQEYPSSPYTDSNGIASVMISGVMANRIGMLEKICGGCDYQDIGSLIGQCEEAGAKGFLFHYDSPGGQASGCPEMATLLASIDVPKIAYTDSLMCSAAYFMGSSCDQIFASPTAEVGSIGCIIPWVDESQLWAAAGIKSDPIVSQDSSLKSAFYGPSLTPEQRQHAQDGVDAMMSMFTAHVSSFRDLDYSALQGGAYFGQAAVDLGLVDQIGSYADAYNALVARIGKSSAFGS